ncbi:MAG: hypothetical protein SFU56_19460 [Capsulimonadales bacterium]|nr:hypothetical protein [Capsulimonadales bacterium]
MSWSVSPFLIPKGTQNFSELIDAQPFLGQAELPEAAEAVKQAKEAAKALIASGAFGSWQEHTFRVSMSGHSNPGNVAPPGWCDDFTGVHVGQTKVDLSGKPLE